MKDIQNQLTYEKSPYLLQHAQNPVNWYPWSEKAFTKARTENKPIFLSIGYSTCHWCHVMARESFEDETVAKLLNKYFVSIKVDREERPDIDSVYMKVCQMMTGQGGWPLSIFMTPEQIPFYAGTYFPKHSKYGMPGFTDVVAELYDRYYKDANHIESITTKVQLALEETLEEKSEHRLTSKQTLDAYEQLSQKFDSAYGGFSPAPKFPQAQHLLFLLRYYYFTAEAPALHMVEKTLQSMAEGGLYDHIGYGFSRYSTDKQWLVPHFEKMLYDNALLLIAYIEAYQVTKHPYYKEISEQIITFIQREMVTPDGAFNSAIDADSEGEEGKYYVWDYDEVIDVLGEEQGKLYASMYDITMQGNFGGKNIPNRVQIPSTKELSHYKKEVQSAREKLLQAREARVYPHVDDKVLTSWNAMMVAALSKAGKVLRKKEYVEMAERAVQFIERNIINSNRIMARYRDGETKFQGYLDDYADLIWAYVELYEATLNLTYVHRAKEVTDQMIELFWDEINGGFYLTGKDAEQLIVKDKTVYDGALPSGNSVASVVLTRMAFITGEMDYINYVDTMYASFYKDISYQASAASFFVQSLLLTEYPTKEVVIIGAKEDPQRQHLVRKLQQAYIPDTTILVGESATDFTNIAPFASEYHQIEDKTTVYICENFACQAPTTNIEEALHDIIF